MSIKFVRVKPLVWEETQMGMWIRAQAGGKVYEIPATASNISQKKAKFEKDHEAYVMSLIEIEA